MYEYNYNYSYYSEMYHHGIKGMKWGRRRYQNTDGTYTAAGKKRRNENATSDPEAAQRRKATAKKAAVITAAAIGVSVAAAYAVKYHPDAVGKVLRGAGHTTVNTLRSAKQSVKKVPKKTFDTLKGAKQGVKEVLSETPKKTAAEKGKDFAVKSMHNLKGAKNTIKKGAKEGAKQGLHDLPKTVVKTAVLGVGMNATKRILDQAVGKEESARIFQANEKKKISNFWKVNDDRDKDDDDD